MNYFNNETKMLLVKKQSIFSSLIFIFFIIGKVNGANYLSNKWGISAVSLGKPVNEIQFQDLLNSNSDVLLLDTFHGLGGSSEPVSPTVCKITHSNDTLYVLFKCNESKINFPLPRVSREVKWHDLLNTPVEQDAYFSDKVDFFLQPNVNEKSYFQFCTTIDGKAFGTKCVYELSEGSIKRKFNPVTDFKSSINKTEDGWTVFLRIPWKVIRGKPTGYFGILPVRTKWRNSEITTPVAMGYADRPAVDLFIEAAFGNSFEIIPTEGALCHLPSGTHRWQRLLYNTYPTPGIKKEIWSLQQSLHTPTSVNNIGNRLLLLNHWINLMEIEGFNFGSKKGSLPEIDIYPSNIRVKINNELRAGNFTRAGEELDSYLKEIDRASRKWFADNSPGNIQADKWSSVQGILNIKEQDTILVITCKTNKKNIELYLSLPSTGGIRLTTADQGFFAPAGLSWFTSRSEKNRYIIENESNKVVITRDPFEMVFEDLESKSQFNLKGANIAFLFDNEGQVIASDLITDLGDETIYGFGEKFDRYNQNKNVLTIWGMDDWEGLTTGMQNQSYKAIPVFHSTRHYMVFVNSSYRLRADIGMSGLDEFRLTLHGDIFDYYFWLSEPEHAIKSYAGVTGKPILPPKWAFEPWMGRKGTAWNAPYNDPVREQKRVIKEFEKLQISHSAIYAEGRGADTPELYQFTHPRDIKVLSWSYPEIRKNDQQKLLPYVSPDSLPLLKIDNPGNLESRNISYVDFTHPNAKQLLREWWKRRLDLGLAGSMVDFGDRVPEDVTFHDGRTGSEMHNFYSYDYHRTYYEVFKERRGDDFILFGRSAAPGTQKWVAQFAGDLRSNFKGLFGALNGMLNLSSSGFSTIGSDLGGFRGVAEPNVYIRWTQLSCFSPLMRAHGRSPREPWEYGETATKNYKFYSWVRYNLLDYIFNAALEANKSGLPIVRPMPFSYPEEYKSKNDHHQYMFGESIMVSPITNDDNTKTIFFPEGSWTNLWNGDLVVGPLEASINFSLLEIPVYIKENAIIPIQLNDKLQVGENMNNNKINALIFTPFRNNKSLTFNKDDKCIEVAVSINDQENLLDISINNHPDLLYLLVYHDNITKIEVNGNLIPQLDENQGVVPASIGWAKDSTKNRTNIRLPYGKERQVKIFLL